MRCRAPEFENTVWLLNQYRGLASHCVMEKHLSAVCFSAMLLCNSGLYGERLAVVSGMLQHTIGCGFLAVGA